MVDIDELRQTLHGPTAIEQLLATIDTLQQQLKTAQARIAELEKRLPPPKDQRAYSLDAEQKRQAKRRPHKNKNVVPRRGRLET